MQTNKRFQITKLLFFILFFLILGFSTRVAAETVSGSDITPKPPKVPTVKNQTITLYEGYQPSAIEVENLLKKSKITFQSSNKKIASVNKAGIVTPIALGETNVIVTITQQKVKYSYSVLVTVKAPYFEISSPKEAIFLEKSTKFEATRFGFNSKVKWKLSKKSKQLAELKTVSSTACEIVAHQEGTITLTASWKEQSISLKIILIKGSGELYVLSPETAPYQNKYTNYSSYNQYTKNYYTMRSYLERLDIAGGGTLILKPGTYSMTNTLCIPSNSQLRFQNGVTIKKSSQTGSNALIATRSLFQLVSYRSAAKQGYYKKYNGEKNIQLIGEGNATIDLDYLDTAAIVMAHNSGILIQGITFKNMNTNHFIELDASQDVLIQNNVFSGYLDSTTGLKEAINVDTPDLETRGFNQYWTSYDGTPNLNITIQNNVFENLECAIGTHKYTENKRHKNMTITGNTFQNIKSSAIQMMNWDSPIVTNNSFDTIATEAESTPAIAIKGVYNPTITENTFLNLSNIVEAYPWKNKGYGSIYAVAENKISKENITALGKNYISNVSRNFFMIYPYYNDFKNDIGIYFIEDEYNLTPEISSEEIPTEPTEPTKDEDEPEFPEDVPPEDIIPEDEPSEDPLLDAILDEEEAG